MMRSLFAMAALAFTLFGCSSSPEHRPLFSRLDEGDTGIDFVNLNTETERSNILTYEYFYNGGGVAFGDINNDGLLDVYFTSTIYDNKLYLNKGDFRFEDITQSSGTACAIGWKTGVSMVDINADGFLDIYVCRSASPDPQRRKNILLINNGNNTFTDKAKEFNLDDDSYSTQAAFFDYDHDNDLDVVLLNHSTLDISNSFLINLRNSTTRYPHVGNKFLKNENGKFIDVSDSVGVFGPASNYGLGVSLSDVNNDGWIDIYTGCDYTGRDKLLINQQGRSFVDATDRLSHISKFTMGTDIADFNGDGWMDIYTLDMLPEGNKRQKQLFGADKIDVYNSMVKNGLHHQYMRNMLHLNNGNGSFSEVGQLAGVANTDWSWAALFADYDNDGIQDLFVTNGFKRDLTDNDFAKYKAFEEIGNAQRQGKKISFLEVIAKFSENKIPNYVFKGTGNLSFKDMTDDWGLGGASLTNGAAYGDLDNDGDLDLVTNNINEPAGVYRNNANELAKNNYLRVRLVSSSKNKNALGAKVTVLANGKLFTRENLPVRGFESTVDPVLHFGLGDISIIDTLKVNWADGSEQVLTSVKSNQLLTVTADATRQSYSQTNARQYFIEETPSTIRHIENDFVDFRVQALLPRMYSTEGPALATADVNGDGLNDIFLGGSKGQSDELWVRTNKGLVKSSNTFIDSKETEAVDALFFDADGDRDQDLYVVTGGYEFDQNDPLLKDRLYINNGKGIFTTTPLPDLITSGSCVTASDVDGDGDVDLFVGGRIVPGRYPETPESTILINDGKGKFSIDQHIPESLKHAGMITDAVWVNMNADSYPDLVIVGEWMPVKVFMNDKGTMTESSSTFIAQQTTGFWNCILTNDFDGDGDPDFIIGNQGLNTQLKASDNQPVTLVYDDFDKNGSIDPVVNYYIQGKDYPYPTRDELTEQLPSFKKRFTDYKSYAVAQIKNVLTKEEFDAAKKLTVSMLQTCYVRNDGGKLTFSPMPIEMQIAPVCALALIDVDGDTIADVVSGGNISASRARTGRMTGNSGFVFLHDGHGNFKTMPSVITGLNFKNDVREIIVEKDELIVGATNGPVQFFKKNSGKSKNTGLVKNKK
jgi:enediyne biosynthesis protein E4